VSLPVIHLSGDARAQGVAHGRQLRDRIAHNLSLYFERFEREVGLSRAEALDIGRRYAAAIERQNPAYYAGMLGVAEGGGFAFDELAALNVRYEILYYKFGKNAIALAEQKAREQNPDGCTAFAVLPEVTESGRLLMGQNWDWIPEVQGAVLHTTDPDGFETLAYTEAGIVGAKIGFNAAGVGLCINGMTTVEDDWSRLAKPFHVRCYEILRSRTFEDAVNVVTEEARSCAGNFLIARAPAQVADVEAAPDVINVLSCQDGCLTHANHFVDPAGSGVEEAPNERRIYSWNRQNRLRELLLAAAPLTVEKIQDALRDTQDEPFGICRHRDYQAPPEQHYITVTSVVMDPEARTLYLTDGPPDEAPYQTVTLP
jgi:Acyl-coenzyme A:6-aminopenicillanic acid acyl-transferase.